MCSLLDSAHLSKSALKNKKRAEKRTKARIEQIKQNSGTTEEIEMKDPVAVLREQLQEAKDNKVCVASERLKSNWKKWYKRTTAMEENHHGNNDNTTRMV